MILDPTEFIYVCERVEKPFDVAEIVQDPVSDYLAEFKTNVILFRLFRVYKCPDFDPKVNWL